VLCISHYGDKLKKERKEASKTSFSIPLSLTCSLFDLRSLVGPLSLVNAQSLALPSHNKRLYY
jgi:hypothetical protein